MSGHDRNLLKSYPISQFYIPRIPTDYSFENIMQFSGEYTDKGNMKKNDLYTLSKFVIYNIGRMSGHDRNLLKSYPISR